MKSTVEILEQGLERVMNGWCQGAVAMNEVGDEYDFGLWGWDYSDEMYVCPPADTCQYCASGAVGSHSAAMMALVRELPSEYVTCSGLELDRGAAAAVFCYNDAESTTQNDIIELFKRAIAAERGDV